MKFLDILETIEQIRKLCQVPSAKDLEKMCPERREIVKDQAFKSLEKARDDWHVFQEQVRKDHGAAYEDLLKKIAVVNRLVPVLQDHPIVDTATIGSTTLYQQILPICELAYLYEQNGDAKEHAAKIAMIFKDNISVISWLLKYGRKIKDKGYLVHDACLFDLPDSEKCTFHHWKKLANEGDNMLTPSFRKLLPHAPAIEALVASEALFKSKNSQKLDSKLIEAAEKSVKLATSNYRKKKRASTNTLTAAEKLIRIDALKELAQKKFEANRALTEVCRGIPVHKLSVQKLRAYYELYKSKSNQSHKILIDNGISEKDIHLFDTLKRCNDDQAIPNIFINGADIGYPGFYLKKLDIESDQGAALAACLGLLPKITCCQYLGGAGSSCAEHGISSPNGGFYVVYKGNAEAPNLDDEMIAASWVWNSQNGALCLDSIESKHDDKLDIITDLYRYAGHTLCHSTIPEQRPINHINTGAQSGITSRVAKKDYPTSREHFKDYAGYTDAKSQLMLANSSMPYLFYNQVHSSVFQALIKKQSENFFSAIFQNIASLHKSELLKQAIAFALYSKNDALLTLLEANAGERLGELRALIGINRRYIEALDRNSIDFDALERGAYINAMCKTGESALHMAALADNEADVRRLIKSGINLDIQDKHGNTTLIVVLEQALYQKKNEKANLLAHLLIESGANIDIKDKDENTPLIIAVKNGDFPMVRYLVDEHKADIETFDGDMKTAIFWAAERGYVAIFDYLLDKNAKTNLVSYKRKDSLLMAAARGGNQMILKALLSRNSLAFRYKNEYCETILHCAAKNPECLKILIALIPEVDRLDILRMNNKFGKSAFHCARENPESLKVLFTVVPNEHRLDILKSPDLYGKILLHCAIKCPDALEFLFKIIPEDHRLEALTFKSKYNRTIWHEAIKNPESLKFLLTLIPEEHRLVALELSDYFGHTALYQAVNNPDSLKVLFEYLPKKNWRDVFEVNNNSENTLLHLSAKNTESLKIILDIIPIKNRLNALLLVNKYNQTVLHLAADKPDSISFLVTLIPEEDRLSVLQMKDVNGQTVWYGTRCNFESLLILLALIPQEQKLDALKMVNYGKTVLHLVARNPDHLKAIFSLFPKEQWADILKITDASGETVMHYAIEQPESLQFIFELIPVEQRVDMLKMSNHSGQMLLHEVTKKPKSLKVLFALLTKEQWLDAFRIPHWQMILPLVAREPELVQILLTPLSEEQRLEAMKIPDAGGCTVLHRLTYAPESLNLLLSLVPEKHKLDVLMRTNNDGDTVILYVMENHKSLHVLFSSLSEEQRQEALNIADEDGCTILHRSIHNLESLQVLLSFIPEMHRLDALKRTNNIGQTVFHRAAENIKSLQVLLNALPEEQRLDIIQIADKHGRTILHYSASKPEFLNTVLSLIPEDKRIDALNETDNFGETPFHCAVENPESVQVLLTFLTDEQRYKALNVTDEHGRTILHYRACNPESLYNLLSLIPEDRRLDALKRADNFGDTPFHYAAANPECMKVIHNLTVVQRFVYPDAFYPVPSPKIPKQSRVGLGFFKDAETTLFEQFIEKFSGISPSSSIKEKKYEALWQISIIIKKIDNTKDLKKFYRALNDWELRQPFFKKHRHFFRTASMTTNSWQTIKRCMEKQSIEIKGREFKYQTDNSNCR